MNTSTTALRALAALCLMTAAWSAKADPNDYIRTPVVEQGEREIDVKTGVQRNRDGSVEAAHSVGLGYAPNSWWFTEVYAKYKRPAGETTALDAWEWENRFQLTETGKYPVDVGLLLEIERPKDRSEGYEVTWGPMFQTEWGLWQANANVYWQKHLRATAAFDTELMHQWQLKYRHSAALEWGAQALGGVGRWNHWSSGSQQVFKIGPALFGKITTGQHQAIKWNAAILAGATHGTPKATLRFQAEYEF